MELEAVLPSNEPRLGLFWFIAKDRSPSRFASLSRPFSGVSEVAGFKTLDEGHVDVWPTVQRLDQTLADYEYDYFPRGRVNWRKEDDRWLLVLDPKLNRRTFITYIVRCVENTPESITRADGCSLSQLGSHWASAVARDVTNRLA